MLKLVIFDMDGLMFDTEAVMFRAFMEVTGEMGFKATREQYVSLIGLGPEEDFIKYKEWFGPEVDSRALYRLGGERKLEILDREGIPVKKGLYELLTELDRLGIMKAVASSSGKKVVIDNLERAGIADRFDYLLSAEEIERGKPFPDIFLNVCRKLDVKPCEALVLEDSLFGVQASLNGGIPVIQIPDMLELPEYERGQCLAVKDSLDEVIPLVREMGRDPLDS